jgi:hypothetical protein
VDLVASFSNTHKTFALLIQQDLLCLETLELGQYQKVFQQLIISLLLVVAVVAHMAFQPILEAAVAEEEEFSLDHLIL